MKNNKKLRQDIVEAISIMYLRKSHAHYHAKEQFCDFHPGLVQEYRSKFYTYLNELSANDFKDEKEHIDLEKYLLKESNLLFLENALREHPLWVDILKPFSKLSQLFQTWLDQCNEISALYPSEIYEIETSLAALHVQIEETAEQSQKNLIKFEKKLDHKVMLLNELEKFHRLFSQVFPISNWETEKQTQLELEKISELRSYIESIRSALSEKLKCCSNKNNTISITSRLAAALHPLQPTDFQLNKPYQTRIELLEHPKTSFELTNLDPKKTLINLADLQLPPEKLSQFPGRLFAIKDKESIDSARLTAAMKIG